MRQILSLMVFALISFPAWAYVGDKAKEQKEAQQIFTHLKQMTDLYSSETGLYSKFKRTQTLSLLGETDTAKGELYYSKSRLRLDLNGKEKSMVLITPSDIWNVSYEDKKPQNIVRSKPVSMPLLDLLFGDKKIWDKFEIINVHLNTDSRMDVTLKPKKDAQISYVAKVRLNLDKKRNIVKKLTYWDDIDNETEMSFNYNRFKDKIDESLFKFVPPKDATVTVL